MVGARTGGALLGELPRRPPRAVLCALLQSPQAARAPSRQGLRPQDGNPAGLPVDPETRHLEARIRRCAACVSAPGQFVRDNTVLIAPPLVPEIRLHLAVELIPLWRSTEEELAAQGVPPPYWAFAWPGRQALVRYILAN